LIMAGGIIYYYTNQPPAIVEGSQYLGDPRTSCAYPIEMVDPDKMRYTMEGGLPDTWDEVPDSGHLKKNGYQPCK